MTPKLTPAALALISTLVRFDLPKALRPRVNCSLTAGQFAAAALLEGPPCGPDADGARALGAIVRDGALADLEVIQYINHNRTNGFVGYAFSDDKGSVLAAFRGSETAFECVPTNIDWLDNVRAPFDGSVQYRDIKRFVAPYEGGAPLFTGHSKGAHNALYALAVTEDPGARCVCFDGQGFAPGQLRVSCARRLSERAVNYVQENDIVGALLCHPEKRVFVKSTGTGNAHALSAMAFDREGYPVPGRRSLISYAAGIASRALYRGLSEDTQGGEEARVDCPRVALAPKTS